MTPVGRGRPAYRLGYGWEREIVNRIRGIGGWHAKRIGSSARHMPDVIAYAGLSLEPGAFVFECKATSGGGPIRVQADQVRAMREWLHGPLRPCRHAGMVLACRWSGRGAERFYVLPAGADYAGALTARHDREMLDGVGDPVRATGWRGVRSLLERRRGA